MTNFCPSWICRGRTPKNRQQPVVNVRNRDETTHALEKEDGLFALDSLKVDRASIQGCNVVGERAFVDLLSVSRDRGSRGRVERWCSRVEDDREGLSDPTEALVFFVFKGGRDLP